MITVYLTKFFVQLLVLIAKVLPDYTPPPAADLGAFQFVAWLVPINEIVNIASAMGAFALASLIYMTYNWIINKMRGSG